MREVGCLSTKQIGALASAGRKNWKGDNIIKPDVILSYNQGKQELIYPINCPAILVH